ncbi:MAG: lamin tail domain-containing protein [Bacteroidota bacterium]|nr:lamin tail domain-containing protein [Bacteroidota bacterium]
MKKFLLSVITLSASLAANAQCNELFISEYVEGAGNDKAIELYNPSNSPIDLTGYTLERYSGGSTTSAAGGVLNLTGTVAAHSTFVIVNGQTTVENGGTSPAVTPALQAYATTPNNGQLDHAYPAPTYMNGDDAIALQKNGVKVDIFGKIGEDPGTSWSTAFPFTDAQGTWITKDYTLQRKATVNGGVTVNPTTFEALVEYDSLAEGTWTGLGTHTCSCPVGINEIDNSVSVIVYPNPSNNNFFNVSSSETIKVIELYNVVGQQVIQKEGNKTDKQIIVETGSLAKGIYTVKVLFVNNKTSIVKVSIQ